MNYAWDANRDGQNYSDGFKSSQLPRLIRVDT